MYIYIYTSEYIYIYIYTPNLKIIPKVYFDPGSGFRFSETLPGVWSFTPVTDPQGGWIQGVGAFTWGVDFGCL